MKIYLAARYAQNAEMRKVRDKLHAVGHRVTSRWIDLHGGTQPTSVEFDSLNSAPEKWEKFAIHDVEDLSDADVVISFTSVATGSKGGRHVEFGLALGLDKHLIIVGPRENVFHGMRKIEHFKDSTTFEESSWLNP